jgi:hypothetical protein
MIATAWAYKLLEIRFYAAYYVGDDSFIFPFSLPDLYTVTIDMELFFNLVAKVIIGKGNYFCSCFFVHTGSRWVVLPDPIKRIERLSYPLHTEKKEDLHDRWLSFRDMCKEYNDPLATEELQRQSALRYAGSTIRNACAAIVTLMDSYSAFTSLYRDYC